MIRISAKLLLIVALLLVLMRLLSGAVHRFRLSPEWGRKLLHLGMGSITLGLPWLLGRYAPVPVALLAAVACAWLIAVRISPPLKVRFGAALHAVNRSSWGEIYFVAGIAVTYLLAGADALCFALPTAVLTLADTAAAVAGSMGSTARHPIGINGKSVEGCAAFFIVSLICAVAALSVGTHLTPFARLSVATQLAFDTAALEVIGARGADNLLIPVGGVCLLPPLLNGSAALPAVHWALAAVLLALWRAQRPSGFAAPEAPGHNEHTREDTSRGMYPYGH